jgi:hypothetical protein
MTARSASRAGSQRMPARREGGQARVGEQLVEKFRAQGGHHLHRAGSAGRSRAARPS